MTTHERWQEAQAAEREYWSAVSQPEATSTVEEVLDANQSLAEILRTWVRREPSPALEIGVGGLGTGLLGFLPSIPVRIGVDPLPLIHLSCAEDLRRKVLSLRHSVQFVRASGENLPFPNEHAGLVVCCNVFDHVNDAPQVLQEVFRVLRPSGLLFLHVDTFSYLGLVKWHLWTKRRRANEILVRAHPYRFLEPDVEQSCRAAGFEIVRRTRRGPLDRLIGHSIRSSFLARKPATAP